MDAAAVEKEEEGTEVADEVEKENAAVCDVEVGACWAVVEELRVVTGVVRVLSELLFVVINVVD